jgi:hypothetical protein
MIFWPTYFSIKTSCFLVIILKIQPHIVFRAINLSNLKINIIIFKNTKREDDFTVLLVKHIFMICFDLLFMRLSISENSGHEFTRLI